VTRQSLAGAGQFMARHLSTWRGRGRLGTEILTATSHEEAPNEGMV
jgi:hypothetical protein